jgi:hypothetical protein
MQSKPFEVSYQKRKTNSELFYPEKENPPDLWAGF